MVELMVAWMVVVRVDTTVRYLVDRMALPLVVLKDDQKAEMMVGH
jgi:hypothetical protein